MANPAMSGAAMIPQLEQARKLALQDPRVYAQVVPGILPLIIPAAAVEVRRWGADFFAECFASPSLPTALKEQLASQVLGTLKSFLENPNEDAAVMRSVVQTAASIYPLVFRQIISHPDQQEIWQNMQAVKLIILQRMDTFPMPVRICCVKFVQKVVQVETPGLIADPRRPEHNETSIALIPRGHLLLSLQNLEAEASGLLDRLLGIFQDHDLDPIMIDATLNCLAILIRSRPAIANKIIAAILNFNPLRQAKPTMSPRLIVVYRSMERTTQALLKYILRNMPGHPLQEKIQAYRARLQQSRANYFSETTSLKRPAEPTDGLDNAKRQRLTTATKRFPPMPPPPVSIGQLFTLTEDPSLQQFDAKLITNFDIIHTATHLILQHMDQNALFEAVGVVKGRFDHLVKASLPTPVPDVPMAGPTGIDDEDDYDPEAGFETEASTQQGAGRALEELGQPAINLGPFELPKPPPLTGAEIAILSDQTVGHVFRVVQSVDPNQVAARQKLGFNRIAASANDRDAWVTILTRLATRSGAGLDEYTDTLLDSEDQALVKQEDPEAELPTIANRIRQTLFMYILDDFRPRLNIAISWLTEEWFADKITGKRTGDTILRNYDRWSTRLLDRLLPYLDARDRNLLIRFLSEVPSISAEMLDLVKTLSRDPERINMCILSMQYLLMMRPPVRELVLDTVESIWLEGDAQAKKMTEKILQKWRPDALAAKKEEEDNEGGVVKVETELNGLKSPDGGNGVAATPLALAATAQ